MINRFVALLRWIAFRTAYQVDLAYSRVFDRFESLARLSSLEADSIRNSKKIALLALWPERSDSYSTSFMPMINGLQESGYLCVFISNKKTVRPDWIPSEAVFISRKNRGRDFGAYKYGFKLILKNGSDCSNLIFANDTLYWFESSAPFINRIEKFDFGSIYTNLEQHTHAQSFFLHFSELVIKEKFFREFWAKYLNSRFKWHAIHKGEVGLTSLLQKNGFTPNSIVTSEIEDLESLNSGEGAFETHKHLLRMLSLGGIKPVNGGPVRSLIGSQWSQFHNEMHSRDINLPCDEYSELKSWLATWAYSDPPHRIGHFLSILYKLPLKRDMWKFINPSELKEVLRALSPDHWRSLNEDSYSKLSKYMDGSGSTRIKRAVGEI